MLDQHGSGGTLRLPQSYTGGFLERDGFTDSVTYDDALVVEALLARGTAEDVSRAATLGRSLLYVQANDPRHDGRMRAAYAPSALTGPGRVVATDPTSDVGNMAWVGLALLRLYQRTGDTGFRDGAVRIGDWIQANARDTRGHGGYIGGFDTDGSRLTWKSTEHNLDVYAFFTSLAASTGDAAWRDRAGWARTFAVTMYDTSAHRFQTGTDEDGVHVNRDLLPSDTQTWSYLALHDAAYAGSLDYAATALSATDGPFSGVSFSLADRSRVWFEGTAHLADALLLRGGPGDVARADAYLATIRLAQRSAPNNDGMGIVAASRDGLKTGDGSDKYYASLHTGATAWYLLALRDADPFR
jgi:hypothetical protein